MKKKIVIISSFIIMSAILIGFKNFNYTNNKEAKSNSESNLKTLSNIPLLKAADSGTVKKFKANYKLNIKSDTSAKAYKVKQIDAKIKAYDLAKRFNIKIKSERKQDNIYAVYSDQGTILVSPNGGGFVYYNNISNKNSGNVPNNDACVNLAVNFLKNVKLYETNFKADKISENFVEYQGGKRDVESKDVYFNFSINNIAVNSGNIVVQIGKNGSVLSVIYNKKELELIGDYPIISKSEAISQANIGKAVYSSNKVLGDTAYVNDISLVYLDNGPFSDQFSEYHPIYMLNGSVDQVTGEDKFIAEVKAIKSEYIDNQNTVQKNDADLIIKSNEFNQFSELFLNNKKLTTSDSVKNTINDLLSKIKLKVISYGNVEQVTDKMNSQLSSTKYIDIRYADKKIKLSIGENLKNSNFDIERIVIPLDKSINKIYFYSNDQAIIAKPTSDQYITDLINGLK